MWYTAHKDPDKLVIDNQYCEFEVIIENYRVFDSWPRVYDSNEYIRYTDAQGTSHVRVVRRGDEYSGEKFWVLVDGEVRPLGL